MHAEHLCHRLLWLVEAGHGVARVGASVGVFVRRYGARVWVRVWVCLCAETGHSAHGCGCGWVGGCECVRVRTVWVDVGVIVNKFLPYGM